ncbi:MAG: hypothetical protein JSW40_00790 [Candidatus Omnitrophota bacterium]|nr:MAG: hypothetical protein JSW40_00790 [Candidatus Omnitrophota bacterium]
MKVNVKFNLLTRDGRIFGKKAGMFLMLLSASFFLLNTVFFAFAQEEYLIPVIKFKDADIKVVLQSIADKATREGARVNIITSPTVKGLVTVELENVSWLTALEGVLKAYGYGYEWIEDNLILVATLEELVEKREKEALAAQQEPLETIAYKLKFLDANDVVRLIQPQLTSRGTITVLTTEPQKGWRARGGLSGEFAQAAREAGARPRSNTLLVTDTKSNIRNIVAAIEQIDIIPKQVLIEARIMEVGRDWLKDVGFDYATGPTGVTGGSAELLDMDFDGHRGIGGWLLGDVNPSVFSPKSSDITGIIPYTAGLELAFRKFTGSQFEVILHAMEESVHANILSAPRIVTLDGQEAYIMIGEKRPIIKSAIQSSETDVGISKSMDYYQNLGIELNVVPQVCDDDYVNLIIYPSITSSTEDVDATSQIGAATSTDSYPIIDIRETQTQILMKNGETIAIGGLLKDVRGESIVKVPLLGDLPLIGLLFQRRTVDTEKVDLIIFLTVRVLNPGEVAPQEYITTSFGGSSEEE